jgi:hypothetical protein
MIQDWYFVVMRVDAYHLLHWVTVWVIRGRVTVKEPVMVRWPGWERVSDAIAKQTKE